MLVLQDLEEMYWLTLILTLNKKRTTQPQEEVLNPPSCLHRYASLLEILRSPTAQELTTEYHVVTANVAAAAASLQLPNREDKVADLLHPQEMCILPLISPLLLLLSCLWLAHRKFHLLPVFKVMGTALQLIQWQLSMQQLLDDASTLSGTEKGDAKSTR